MMGGSKISCVGIIGDGCGGGREFIVEDEVLYAYDSLTDEKIILLQEVYKAKSISKKACVLLINCEDKNVKFDLSLMKVV